LGILSFLFVEDDISKDILFLNPINNCINIDVETSSCEDKLNFKDLFEEFPVLNAFYHYEGSLTTPPCSETVNWYINKNIRRTNRNQLAKFRALW